MRTLTTSIGLFIAVLAAPVLAADPPAKPGGGVVAPAAQAPSQKKHKPYASGLRFSVPYSFANVHKDLKNAIIRCDVLGKGAPLVGGTGDSGLGVSLPGLGGVSQPTAIGSGSVVIALNGQPLNGTAMVIPKPNPGASFDEATGFQCLIQLNNGFQTVSPGTGANVPSWAKSQAGSHLGVSGAIK